MSRCNYYNIISGTIHRIQHATSNWEDKGVRKAIQDWESNQYHPGFYAPVLRKTVQTIVEGQTKTFTANIEEVKGEKPSFCLQYRGKASDSFARQLRSFNVSTIFTTRKLRSCLPSVNSDFPKVSEVVWSTKLIVQAAAPAMLAKRFDI